MLCLFLNSVLDSNYTFKTKLQLISTKRYYCEWGSFNMQICWSCINL